MSEIIRIGHENHLRWVNHVAVKVDNWSEFMISSISIQKPRILFTLMDQIFVINSPSNQE